MVAVLTPVVCPYKPCGYTLCAEFGPDYCEHRDAPEQLPLDFSVKDPEDARRMIEHAMHWIDTHRAVWPKIVRLVDGGMSIKAAVEHLRMSGEIHVADGERFGVANALPTVLVRLINAWYPSVCTAHIRFAQSKVDGCSLPQPPAWAVKL